MSGFVGLVSPDSAPIDRARLEQLTRALTVRAPDGQGVWHNQNIGLGSALLRITPESENEQQPFCLDDRIWIVADARLDARAELVSTLVAHGRAVSLAQPEVGLIAHAYAVWGAACVEHLLGDFAFVVWDSAQRSLFAARDHFGVKPLYYTQTTQMLLVSNTLDCVRLHPEVSQRLDEFAIADWLAGNPYSDVRRTYFADVACVPPAHSLNWSARGLALRQYASLPIEEAIYYRRSGEYVEHFSELFHAAVCDRLRARRVGILMSGGMDSTSVAAVARQCWSEGGAAFALKAFSRKHQRPIGSDEAGYAQLVADALQIPLELTIVDDDGADLAARANAALRASIAPVAPPTRAASLRNLRAAAEHSRVLLTGFGGDPALYPTQQPLPELIRRQAPLSLARGLYAYVTHKHALPRLYLRSRYLARATAQKDAPLPQWYNADFAKRVGLDSRARSNRADATTRHPRRPEAYQALRSTMWQKLFQDRDPGATRLLLEFRYPFFDWRLISFLLRVPPVPWFIDKYILREAMRGILPEAIRTRRKTPFGRDLFALAVQQGRADHLDALALVPGLEQFINIPKFIHALPSASPADFVYASTVLQLAEWLWQRSQPIAV